MLKITEKVCYISNNQMAKTQTKFKEFIDHQIRRNLLK